MKSSESEGEHDVRRRIPRLNSRGVNRTFLGTLHCEPVGLVPISQHRRDVGRHPNKSSLALAPLLYRLQVQLFTLCPPWRDRSAQ